MKVLVVGSGGREHALCWKLAQSPLKPQIFCAPGNAGTREVAQNVELQSDTPGALALWAVENKIDLTVVGPEAPLADGLVDLFVEHGLKVFGPTKAAARLESSKSFAKDVMLKSGVSTAKGAVFEDYAKAREYVEEQGAPIVIKADGLASGKGVVVAATLDEAFEALESFMVHGRLGSSGSRVVVEECLVGREASVMVLVDGTTVLPLVVSQDFKRIGDGDTGPNTGGMGSISPTPVLSDMRVENLVGEIFLPVLRELHSRGIHYSGFLYAGLLVDRSGTPKVLEFNCRLGDPETQVLMMRMKSDLLSVLEAAVDVKLHSVELEWHNESAACIVLASGGYPGTVDDGKLISGLRSGDDGLQVFHAGTVADSQNPDQVRTKGGRILGVTARGETLEAALERAYDAVAHISFDGMQYRKDIGGRGREAE
ncbi:MAG: phosphoribosylamine--glycine ligase [Bdellovibrionota bacterium]